MRVMEHDVLSGLRSTGQYPEAEVQIKVEVQILPYLSTPEGTMEKPEVTSRLKAREHYVEDM